MTDGNNITFVGDPVVPGSTTGKVLKTTEPLSFWGGYDAATGEIVDRRHPLSSFVATEKILVMPFTRGSSTTTAVLLEAVRAGKAPSAIISCGRDSFLSLASIVADEMYKKPIPIISVSQSQFSKLETGQLVTIKNDGTVTIQQETNPNSLEKS